MHISLLDSELEKHGELHIVVEEHESVVADSEEDYIGLREGNTEFDSTNEVIRVDDGTKEHVIDADSVIYYHAPRDFPD